MAVIDHPEPPKNLNPPEPDLITGRVVFPVVKRGIPVDIHPLVDGIRELNLPVTEKPVDIPEAEFDEFSYVIDLYGIELRQKGSPYRIESVILFAWMPFPFRRLYRRLVER